MNKNFKSLLMVLGMGLFGYVLARIGSISAPPEIAKEITMWTVLFFVVIAIIIDVAEFSYNEGKNSK